MVLEPLTPQSDIRGLLADLEAHRIVKRTLNLATAVTHRADATGADVAMYRAKNQGPSNWSL